MGNSLKEPTDHRAKPEGGYVQISTVGLGLLTWCHKEGLLSLRAMRAGLALYELRTRRRIDAVVKRKQGRGEPTPSHYSTKELGKLCGLPTKRAATALGELLGLGFLAEFSPAKVRFASSLSDLSLSKDQLREFLAWLPTFTKRKRVPLPRRILVLASETSSPALIAFILSVCVRCSWLKQEGFSYSGRLSPGWVSRRFGICLRATQRAKSHLMALKWIHSEGIPHRLGDVVTINPAWSRLLSLPECEKEIPRAEFEDQRDGTNRPGVNPLDGTIEPGGFITSYESSPKEKFKDQRKTLGLSRPEFGPGVSNPQRQGQKNQDQSSTLPPPRLSRILLEDLRSTERLLGAGGLFAQAVRAKLLNEAEADQQYFVACAERARTAEVRSPCAVFNALINDKKKFWNHVSAEQEDAARRRIREWRNSKDSGGVPFVVERGFAGAIAREIPPATGPLPRLSDDATKLQRLKNHGFRNLETVYPTLREKYGWDRPRFVSARAELEKLDQPFVANAFS